ncbi:GGDEF domain-containing protein [Roseomonas sp. JC162]|uniref:GGDEF domain-containing protein n=1 Tax=Neoroseomonas marina TaxID=1232220 RepID=A0A848EE88_9PROT|nr:GGDEF domain-containing protein [Neoroseomonas marina]
MNGLAGLAGTLVTLGAILAAGAGAYAAWRWRFERSRFLVCVLGIAAALAIVAARTTSYGSAAWLRLLPDAAAIVFFIALLRALARQDRSSRRVAAAAHQNAVTGLPNRSTFIAQMTPAMARCRRDGVPAAILAVAIDGLGDIEARRGPATAEDALRDLAAVLRDTARAGDLPGHLAPTVVAAMLPGTAAEAAQRLAERLRAQVAERLPHPSMDGSRMTVSIGIAAIDQGIGRATLDEAMDAAETALIRVMDAGGDGIRLAEPPPHRHAEAA